MKNEKEFGMLKNLLTGGEFIEITRDQPEMKTISSLVRSHKYHQNKTHFSGAQAQQDSGFI